MVLMDDVLVDIPEGMTDEEARRYVDEELGIWKAKGKVLDKVILRLDGDEVVVKSIERSPITRTRRITGYLSTLTKFNDAKRAELADRVAHA